MPSPDEILRGLKDIGVSLSRVSLTRYEHQDMVPEAIRENRGGPGGCYVDYPLETIYEAYAAYCLLHGEYTLGAAMRELFDGKGPKLTPAAIANIRHLYDFLSTGDPIRDAKADFESALEKGRDSFAANIMQIAFGVTWCDLKKEAENKLSQVNR